MFEVNNYEIKDKQVPEAFNDTVIVQVSDLHSAIFGENQSDLLAAIKEARPDMIAITGDLIDSHYNDIDRVMYFINGAVKIAPTFYVTGNHEAWTKLYLELEEALIKAGVTLLRDDIVEIEKDNQSISIIGLDDPAFSKYQPKQGMFSGIENLYYNIRGNKLGVANMSVSNFNTKYANYVTPSVFASSINSANPSIGIERAEYDLSFTDKLHVLSNQTEGYKILLSHRPEYFKDFVNAKANLVLTGHTHGGQVCFPILGGVYAPNQGVFPEYSDGLYEEDRTKMIISRGLGNSGVPFRLNNPPELIVITLKNK